MIAMLEKQSQWCDDLVSATKQAFGIRVPIAIENQKVAIGNHATTTNQRL